MLKLKPKTFTISYLNDTKSFFFVLYIHYIDILKLEQLIFKHSMKSQIPLNYKILKESTFYLVIKPLNIRVIYKLNFSYTNKQIS